MTKIWTISLDGNAATRQQVEALATGLGRELGNTEIESFFPKTPATATKLPNNTIVTWTDLLPTESIRDVECNGASFSTDWPDYIVSCRPEVAALALSIKQASAGRTKIIHIQNPNDATGAYKFDLSSFDLIVRQPHETISAPNVISSQMALHGVTKALLNTFNAVASPKIAGAKKPILAILVGGSDENLTLDEGDFEKLADDVLALNHDGAVFILTSRRTGEENKSLLQQKLKNAVNINIDDQRLDYKALLSVADKIVVDGGSSSMVSEAVATGKPVSVYLYGDKMKSHPLYPVMQAWEKKELVDFYPQASDGKVGAAFQEIPDLARKVVAFFQNTGTAPNDDFKKSVGPELRNG